MKPFFKLKRKCIISVVVISILVCNNIQAQNATTTVNVSTTVNANTPLLFGITFDCRSGMTGNSGALGYFQNDTTGTLLAGISPLFSDFPITSVRYPANGVMLGFNWKKSIGMVGNRPNQNLLGGLGAAQPVKFGFDEFVAMVTNKGVQGKDIQIMVPIYDSATTWLNTLQRGGAMANVASFNADWVEYCNAPNNGSNPRGGTDWAAIRAANGHPNPYDIKIWNIGNEPWAPGEFGLSGDSCTKYLAYVTPIIDSMLAADPTIKITLPTNGNPSNTNTWNYKIINSTLVAQGKIYGLSQHSFPTETVVNGNITGVAATETLLKSLTTAAAAKGLKVFIGDYAHGIKNASNAAAQDSAMQWLGTNLAVDFLLMNSQLSNFERTNFWAYGMPYAQWHPIRINTGGTYTLMPVAAMYKKLYPLFLDKSVQVTNTSVAASDGNAYAIRASAFAKNNLTKINIIAVNRDKTGNYTFKANGVVGYSIISAKLLTAVALNSDVFNETVTTADINGHYTIPAMGVLILEYTLTPLSLTPCPTTLNAIIGANNVCVGSTATLSNNTTKPSAAIGIWSSLNNKASIHPNTGLLTGTNAGTATIKYTISGGGCNGSITKTITVNALPSTPNITYAIGTINPQIGAGGNNNYCNNKIFDVVGIPNGGSWSSSNNNIMTVSSNGNISLIATGVVTLTYLYTNNDGCTSSRSIIGNVVGCASRGLTINLPNIFSEFTTYPSPASHIIYFKNYIDKAIIYNSYGKKVASINSLSDKLSVSNLPNGLYFIQTASSSSKFIVKH